MARPRSVSYHKKRRNDIFQAWLARQQPIARRVISIDRRVQRIAARSSRAGELAKDDVFLRSAARGGARSARDQIFQSCKLQDGVLVRARCHAVSLDGPHPTSF